MFLTFGQLSYAVPITYDMLVIRAGFYKLLVSIANRKNADQTASTELLCVCSVCLYTRSLYATINASEFYLAEPKRWQPQNTPFTHLLYAEMMFLSYASYGSV